ncbi:cobalamin B12-binding domain-containing protein, partial [Klebsiella pneumoniae]|nr:cobalamin B12-binding domain-containing protein [Klebsiella pneumoniae]
DRHALPTSMAAVALRDDNWHVEHLGADVPPDDLSRFCSEHPTDLVVLTAATSAARTNASRTAKRLEAQGLRVLVGGPGSHL